MNTFRKLRDGSWGVTVEAAGSMPKAGDEVQVSLRDGGSKAVVLGDYVGVHDTRFVFKVAPRKPEQRKVADVGDLSSILALFDKAKQHLKYPAIVLSVPADGETVRVSVAGERARAPGSLTVVSRDREDRDGRHLWLGRVHRDGRFERAGAASNAVVDRLREFAADPAKVASEHGRLTGRCCFCNTALSDERSTAVGYGATCAAHYGLPWGERPAGFAEAA